MTTKDPAHTKPLKFQPLNEGLGFHPFSDGLPYTPASKPPQRATSLPPAGAMAAGKPLFAPIPLIAPEAPPVAAKVAPQKASPMAAEEPLTYGYGYLFRRLWAFLFDTSLNFTVIGTGLAAALWRQSVPAEVLLNAGVLLFGAAFALFFNWALITSQEIAFGTSIGKRLFGLSLFSSPSRTLVRALLFVPVLALGGLGLLIALFSSKKRCLHDLLTGAQPADLWNHHRQT